MLILVKTNATFVLPQRQLLSENLLAKALDVIGPLLLPLVLRVRLTGQHRIKGDAECASVLVMNGGVCVSVLEMRNDSVQNGCWKPTEGNNGMLIVDAKADEGLFNVLEGNNGVIFQEF